MKKALLPVLFAICVFGAIGEDTIPSEIVGVWAPAKSKLQGGLIYDGYAVYIKTNGQAAIVAAPPPIGTEWRATYDATNYVLTLTINANPSEGLMQGMTNHLTYDSRAKTLTMNSTNASDRDVLTRHGIRVPSGVFE